MQTIIAMLDANQPALDLPMPKAERPEPTPYEKFAGVAVATASDER